MQLLMYFFTAFILFNGVVQNGFGIQYVKAPQKVLVPILSMLLSSVTGWIIVKYLLNPLGFGVFGVFILFPLSVVCSILVAKIALLFCKDKNLNQFEPALNSGFYGIAFYGAFQTVMFAQTAIQAILFALGSTAGFVSVIAILRGIQKRSEVEAVPKFFKGQPLLLISTGLISLIFTELLPMVIHIFAR